MKISSLTRQSFTRPLVIWLLFIMVFTTLAAALAVVARQALELNRHKWLAAGRERVEQNVRVALWRTDSRLGPFLATLHEPSIESDRFVNDRFAVRPLAAQVKGESMFEYVDASNESRLQQLVPIGQLVSALRATIPENAIAATGKGLVQRNNPKRVPRDHPQARSPIQQAESQYDEFRRDQAIQLQIANAVPSPIGARGGFTLAPLWVEDQLVLVRQENGNRFGFDGVWIDWFMLRDSLLDDIRDLFPPSNVQLLGLTDDEVPDPTRSLAALPVKLVPRLESITTPSSTHTHTALALAWLALIGAGALAAFALHRSMQLNQRRAAFVSAVTHELRTPLTTFRLYSDMLARDMVSDPHDRKEYFQTLRREADRLTHLVDNVLRYSKLERGSKRPVLESVVLSEWLSRITPRLTERLAQADMQLCVEIESDGRWMTDPAALEQVVFNLIDNSAKYAQPKTDRRVHIQGNLTDTRVTLCVIDHGQGVPSNLRATMFKPFTKSVERAAETAAGVGLGLSLAKQTAAALGGKLDYNDGADGGAVFCVQLPRRKN